ncbi:MAG: DMT family transporter [Thermodesulfobacteriota bacterium]
MVQAKFILPVGLIAISLASVLIKICEAPPLIIAAYRLGLATLILLILFPKSAIRGLSFLSRKEFLLCFLAGIFLCFHFAFWITSLKYTSVASSIILVTTNPIFVALASTFFFREKISLILLSAILLAILGGVLIAWEDFTKGRDNLWGDALALAGAVMASGYLLVGRRIRQKLELVPYITLVYGVAAIFLITLALLNGDLFFNYAARDYIIFFLLAIFPQLVGHTSLNWALKFFSATLVAVIILGEPIGATILAYIFLAEPLTKQIFWGGTLVLMGIYLAAREEARSGRL